MDYVRMLIKKRREKQMEVIDSELAPEEKLRELEKFECEVEENFVASDESEEGDGGSELFFFG
jgi:hypothetical protein